MGTTVLSEQTLRELSLNIGQEWETLASFLDLEATEIEVIKMDNPGQTQNQIFNMLIKWQKKLAVRADQAALLGTAFRRARRADLAEKLKSINVEINDRSSTKTTDCDASKRPTGRRNTFPRTTSSKWKRPDTAAPPVPCDKKGTTETATQLTSAPKQTPSKNEQEYQSCSVHNGAPTKFFCETCKTLICKDCTRGIHPRPQHSYIESKLASEKYRQSLSKDISKLNLEIKDIEKSRGDTSKIRETFQKKVPQTVEVVHRTAEKMIAEIRAEEKRKVKEIRELEQHRAEVFRKAEERASAVLQWKRRSLDAAEKLQRVASNCGFLRQYFRTSSDFETAVEATTDSASWKCDRSLGYLGFRPSKQVCGGDGVLGRVDLAGTWEMRREFGKMGSGPGEFEMVRDIAARQPGELAVADFVNKRVAIFNNDGDFLCNISSEGGRAPRAVAGFGTQLAVIDESRRAQIYTKNNKTAPILSKRICEFYSVAFRRNGTILLGDVSKNMLTEYSLTDGSLKRTTPVKIKPFFLAIDSASGTNERVVISGGIQKVVHVVDSSGSTQFIIEPTINDEPVYKCMGVCCNDLGIYVAVNEDAANTGHVHQYDLDGKFVTCIAQGLHSPQGLTLTYDGHQLAVADTYSVKVYHKV